MHTNRETRDRHPGFEREAQEPKPLPLGAIRAIERENEAYRKDRLKAVVFVVGILAAIASSFLQWPLRLPIAASVAFAIWALSAIIYSEAYLCLSGDTRQIFGRLRQERKAVKCLILLLLPAVLRLLRVAIFLVLAH